MDKEIKAAIKELQEKSLKKDIVNDKVKIFQAVIERALEINAVKLEEVELTREKYNFYFPEGKIESPEETNHKRLIESIIVFKDAKNIIISAHNKSLHDFSKQIKTADQIIYVDEHVGRIAAHLLKEVGSPVRLQGIKTRAINLNYNQKEILSSNYLGNILSLQGKYTLKPNKSSYEACVNMERD